MFWLFCIVFLLLLSIQIVRKLDPCRISMRELLDGSIRELLWLLYFLLIPLSNISFPFLGISMLQNELAILEFIHLLVETMDRHFGNVVSPRVRSEIMSSELRLLFRFFWEFISLMSFLFIYQRKKKLFLVQKKSEIMSSEWCFLHGFYWIVRLTCSAS